MGARGRPGSTATEGAVVALRPVPVTTMEPPRSTARAQRAVWREVTGSFPAGHFAPCDRQLLMRYCDAAVQAAGLAKRLDSDGVIITNPSTGRAMANPAFNSYVTACACMASLAGRLRICPSARMRQDAADAKPVAKAATVTRPWAR